MDKLIEMKIKLLVILMLFGLAQDCFSTMNQAKKPPAWYAVPYRAPYSYGVDTKMNPENGNSTTMLRYGIGRYSMNHFEYFKFLDFGIGLRNINNEKELIADFTFASFHGIIEFNEISTEKISTYSMVGAKLLEHEESNYLQYKNTWLGLDFSYTYVTREYTNHGWKRGVD
jgi:hypothetical protein